MDVLLFDFEEYLWAAGLDMVVPVLRDRASTVRPMAAMHQRSMKLYREYMLVGGLPQAVSAFMETRDFGSSDFAKQQILSLYASDIDEQNEESSEYARAFFERIPSELSKHDKRYVLSHIKPSARIREYAGPIRWLEQAMVINIASNVDDPSAAPNLAVVDIVQVLSHGHGPVGEPSVPGPAIFGSEGGPVLPSMSPPACVAPDELALGAARVGYVAGPRRWAPEAVLGGEALGCWARASSPR